MEPASAIELAGFVAKIAGSQIYKSVPQQAFELITGTPPSTTEPWGFEMMGLVPGTEAALLAPTNPVPDPAHIVTTRPSSNPEHKGPIVDIGPPGGPPVYSVVVNTTNNITPEMTAAYNVDSNTLAQTPTGRSLLKQVPDALDAAADKSGNESLVAQATPNQKEALKKMPEEQAKTLLTKATAKALGFGRRQDHSRVSKQYWEWDYSCRKDPAFALYFTTTLTYDNGAKTLIYSNSPDNHPSYGDWVDTPALVEFIRVFRRIKREGKRNGSTKLWKALGHASFEVYLRDLLNKSAEFTVAADAIKAASPEWS